jgi:hypothetical protein
MFVRAEFLFPRAELLFPRAELVATILIEVGLFLHRMTFNQSVLPNSAPDSYAPIPKSHYIRGNFNILRVIGIELTTR